MHLFIKTLLTISILVICSSAYSKNSCSEMLESSPEQQATAEYVKINSSSLDVQMINSYKSLKPFRENEARAKLLELNDGSKWIFKDEQDAHSAILSIGASSSLFESAAYKLSILFGLVRVPETRLAAIVIDGKVVVGSMQRFASNGLSVFEFDRYAFFSPQRKRRFQKQLVLMQIFDYIIANIDRSSDNYLIAKNGDVIPIDHGISLRVSDLHRIDFNKNVNFDDKIKKIFRQRENQIYLEHLKGINADLLFEIPELSLQQVDLIMARIAHVIDLVGDS